MSPVAAGSNKVTGITARGMVTAMGMVMATEMVAMGIRVAMVATARNVYGQL